MSHDTEISELNFPEIWMQTFARWSDGMPGERVDTEAFLCQLLPEWGQGQIWCWCHTDADGKVVTQMLGTLISPNN